MDQNHRSSLTGTCVYDLIVFHGCRQVGADENLLMKDHTHKFVNKGGEIGGTVISWSLKTTNSYAWWFDITFYWFMDCLIQ